MYIDLSHFEIEVGSCGILKLPRADFRDNTLGEFSNEFRMHSLYVIRFAEVVSRT